MTSELQAAVAACASVADRGNVPILATIRMIADGGGMLELTATDTVQTILARIACDGECSYCVDAAALSQKVRTLRAGTECGLSDDGRVLTLTSGRTKWSTPILPIGDFPHAVADLVPGDAVPLPAMFVADVQRAVKHAFEVGGTRDYLAGVHLDPGWMVGTNGNTMMVIASAGDLPSCTIPSAAVAKLSALADAGAMTMTANRNGAMFVTEYMTLITRLVEGEYPGWQRVVPQNENSVTVDRAELQSSISRAAALKADKDGSVQVRVTYEVDEVVIDASSLGGERGSDALRHTGRDGDKSYTGFAASLLSLAVSTLTADTVKLGYSTDAGAPLRIDAVGVGREDFVVIMPQRLRGGFDA